MKFKIDETKVYGLEETLKYSGLPMSLVPNELEKSVERMTRLGNATSGSGHDCALKGIIVQMNIHAPGYWWPQFQRYHFADIVSSQSKMHKLTNMTLENQCNEYVTKYGIELARKVIERYNSIPTQENFQIMMSNIPMGLMLTARITTNYLQLKTIYNQRKEHKLLEWKEFCSWCKHLPYFNEFICKR